MASGDFPETLPLEQFWKAPLVPPGLILTAGILYDRFYSAPLVASLILATVSLIAWFFSPQKSQKGLALVYLGLAFFCLTSAYHHYRRLPGPLALLFPTETLVTIRGVLDEEPIQNKNASQSPLRAIPATDTTKGIVQVHSILLDGQWHAISDRLLIQSQPEVKDIHLGDEAELSGLIRPFAVPKNPGEADSRIYWMDQGIHRKLSVRSGDRFVLLERKWPSSFRGWLMAISRWSAHQFAKAQNDSNLNGLSLALILGDGSALPSEEWQRYQRTGVIQVLVVSGQHLILIAGVFLWILQRTGLSLRIQALIVGLFLFGYVMMTGGRPPGMRSFLMMSTLFASWILLRHPHQGNMLALSWIGIAILNPMDLFSPGCQLSFLSVLAIYYYRRTLISPENQGQDRQNPDAIRVIWPVDFPLWIRFLINSREFLVEAFKLSTIIWLVITPLVAYHYQTVSLVGLILNPILSLLTTLALFLGFLFLVLTALHLPGTGIVIFLVNGNLYLAEYLVKILDPLPLASLSVPSPSLWWITPFLIVLLAFLTLQRCLTKPGKWLIALALWVLVGLTVPLFQPGRDGMTCTFLAVGHGGCTVIETEDGRTILYDVGSLGGPPMANRLVIPFLWSRGIRRIDEVLLSHADLDHFNGLVDLMDRFMIGQLTITPSFVDKESPGVIATLQQVEQRKIPVRIVHAGDILDAGSGITMEVLHPPAQGPPGKENHRSLTLRIQAFKSSILLTGDLEGEGLDNLLKRKPQPVDVLMAPHHGSRQLDAEGLVRWSRPRLVIASQGPASNRHPLEYSSSGRVFWKTEEEGAISLHFHQSGIVADTFVTGQKLVLPSH